MSVPDILYDLRDVADSRGDQGLHAPLRKGVGAADGAAAAAQAPAVEQPGHPTLACREKGHGSARVRALCAHL